MANLMRRALDHADFATVPLAIVGVTVAWFDHQQGASRLGLAGFILLVLGVVDWTLIEYAVHRALHDKRFPKLRRLHMQHHAHPAAPSGGTLYSSAIIAVLLIAAIVRPVAAPFVLGLLVGYFAFIVLHHAEHHGWDLRVCRALADHHDRHHHARPRGCFGVTTSVWDRLFGTL